MFCPLILLQTRMESIFYIALYIKNPEGYACYGKFHIGNDKNFAYSLFSKLKGDERVNSDNILYMDLVETRKNLPINIKMLGCTLQETADNCKIVTKEIFKRINLE
jgi:hypothetical protein